ncbi:MAG TPA: hypothetical protein VFA94_05350, partial [Acidimicrobiales bacterium]|nr:hypothetical protein [Acidimicrobiales bacterium]
MRGWRRVQGCGRGQGLRGNGHVARGGRCDHDRPWRAGAVDIGTGFDAADDGQGRCFGDDDHHRRHDGQVLWGAGPGAGHAGRA